MLTYNGFLFTERKNRGLTRGKMAKLLKISYFSYYFIENGYFKPSKKQIEKISKALDVDYSQYFVDGLTYPAELPEKEKRKIVSWGYRVLGHTVFRIISIAFTAISLGVMLFGLIGENYVNAHQRDYYPEEYVSFVDRLRENGTVHFSVINNFMRPEYYIRKTGEDTMDKYISIIGEYEDEDLSNLVFTATYRGEGNRLLYEIKPSIFSGYSGYLITAKVTVQETGTTITGQFEYRNIDNFSLYNITEVDAKGNKNTYTVNDDKGVAYGIILVLGMYSFEGDFNELLAEKDPTFAPGEENKFAYLTSLYIQAKQESFVPTLLVMLAKYVGIVLTGFGLFVILFSFIYGTRKGKVKKYRETQLAIPDDEIHRMKPDTLILPPLPETLLEIIGIILVFIGSFRIVLYVSSFLDGSFGDSSITLNVSAHMQIFMVGMFLLYFIDFDVFLDDKRVFRNIAMYSIVYVCLYALENLLGNVISDASVVGMIIQRIPMPNMFGTIACYYLIMCFLFYTPKWIKKKAGLIIYRCCSIIPVLFIYSSWFIYNGYDVVYEADWSSYVLNIFNGEKVPFSTLAVLYLFGLFFLRLFFEKKYGVERARIFFNGNKFIWIKNIMISVIILLIAGSELILEQNLVANKLGLGNYTNIIFLIPPLLLYHPHKGPRNVALDWTTTGLYLISIGLAYFIVFAMVLAYLF